jgi:uncharacterized protein YuzE
LSVDCPGEATYEAEAKAAYFYLQDDIGLGGVAQTVPVDPLAIGGVVNLDLDREGRLVGLQVLGARSTLPQDVLRVLDERGRG